MPDSRSWAIVALFMIIAVAQKVMEPMYGGYFLAFFVLSFILAWKYRRARFIKAPEVNIEFLAISLMLFLSIFFSIKMHQDARDIFRDVGAVFAFIVGRYVVPLWVGKGHVKRLMQTLSDIGVAISVITIIFAFSAYLDGADAYHWRGSYVPLSHGWLPYFLIVNIALLREAPEQATNYGCRIFLCIAGTIASLSRTDVLIDIFIGLMLLVTMGRHLFSNARVMRILFIFGIIVISMMPRIIELDVVQERLNSNAENTDPSLEWRYIENQALIDYFSKDSPVSAIVGYGLGARIPLPDGVLDFDGHDTIPLLHNSYLTIILKFGLLGLCFFALYIVKKIRVWMALQKSQYAIYVWAGGWIMIVVLAKGVILQGLTEWSHVLFFGLASMLLSFDTYKNESSK
ncbi:O-antigen ligase family protein [Janthinobacterium sp. RB2P8]|uniref:O-antigen ligase family protein n=1 Tax=Janthinobacterium sp. RB2P8 TaxID=3424191 RepID=UPI003F28AAAE